MRNPNVIPRSPQPMALTAADSALAPTAALLTGADAHAAANDDAAAPVNTVRNPLWIVVVGMACMFGVMAVVIALG
ncbi:MAG TPA: hypothetical protein VK803_08930 [Steroidobacteraceae bacterium]|jgi:hypothetical protein|nr:hypothetical protein [Steroidobacteraceae bacterium]